jgi:glycosyltransferase involved in cell wall biosynthesis
MGCTSGCAIEFDFYENTDHSPADLRHTCSRRMSAPLVSILVPCYNGAQYLPQICESILAQKFRDFEVLIGDDHSTDNSVAVIQPYLRDSRFRLFAWETNRGLHHNLVLLLNLARGQYWCPPGQDDVLHPEFLDRRVPQLAAHPDAVLIHGPSDLIDEKGHPYKGEAASGLSSLHQRIPKSISGERMLRILLQHNILNWPSTVVRMDITRQLLPFFSPHWVWALDWAMWILLASSGYNFLWDPEPMIRYRIHSQSISVSPSWQAVRRAERKLAPFCALRAATVFSPVAKILWLQQRKMLYRWWLTTVAASKWRGTFSADEMLLGAEAYNGAPRSFINPRSELMVHGLSVAIQYWREREANRQQIFRVSGLSLIDDPLFRRD